MQRFLSLFLILVVFSFNQVLANSASGFFGNAKESQTRFIIGNYEDKGSKTVINAGILFDQADNWVIYWKNPGDSGLPPIFDWTGTENAEYIKVLWPFPTRKVDAGQDFEDFVYPIDTVFPLKITPKNPNQPIKIKLKLNYATCNYICVPLTHHMDFTILPGINDQDNSAFIREFENRVPKENGTFGMNIGNNHYINSNGEWFLEIEATVKPEEKFVKPDIIVEWEYDENIKFRTPQIVADGDDPDKMLFRIPLKGEITKEILSSKPVKIIFTNQKQFAVETTVTPPIEETSWLDSDPDYSSATINFGLAILFSIIGGFILNFMPCVLPVLSIKLLSVLKNGEHNNAQTIRKSFLFSAAGIIFTFLVIATATIIMLSLGHVIGFGFQFQEPLFLITLIIILTFFACSLLDIINVPLPYKFVNFIDKKLAHRNIYVNSFLSGILATILATPCTAPFLGTAVSYALSRSASEIYILFSFMGLGMSLPFLLIASKPQFVKILPRPGAWMKTLRSFFGMVLVATAIWLIWVISHQLGVKAALVLFVIVILMKFTLQFKNSRKHIDSMKFALLAFLIFSAYFMPFKTQELTEFNQEYVSEIWQKFDEEKINEQVNAGKFVIVEVGADWCLTCKLNKFTVLNNYQTLQYLQANKVVAFSGDITLPNEKIMNFIKSHHRQGIPFVIVFGPKAPGGIVLSELMTKEKLFSAFREAGL